MNNIIRDKAIIGNLCFRIQQCIQGVGNHHKGHNWKVNCVYKMLCNVLNASGGGTFFSQLFSVIGLRMLGRLKYIQQSH